MPSRVQVSTRVEGLNRLIRQLEQAGGDVEDLKDTMAGIAAKGARLASSFAPKLTGRLAASVRGNRAKSKAVVSAGGGRVPYGAVINYGWAARNIEAAHFMQRVDPVLQPIAIRDLDRGLAAAIRKRGLS